MPLIFNGTEIKEVWANGIRCDAVHMNGVEVYRRAFEANITLSGETFNFHLNNHLTSLGWDGVEPVAGTVTVTGHVGSGGTGFAAFYILELPAGSDIRLVIAPTGSISGAGGRGGRADGVPEPGLPGGDGLTVVPQLTGTIIRVQNDGFIAGGGGGGGAASGRVGTWAIARLGGGGGAGRVAGAASDGGRAGTFTTGGLGTWAVTELGLTVYSGKGGDLGEAGADGYYLPEAYQVASVPGGAAGRAVDGNSRITWDKVGTIYGARVN